MKCPYCGSTSNHEVGREGVDRHNICERCNMPFEWDENEYRLNETEYHEDIGHDCQMCGQPVCYGNEKMCSSCRQVWNG